MDFATVAHDLRTPLNVVLAHVRLLAAEHLSDSAAGGWTSWKFRFSAWRGWLDSCVGQPNRLARTTPST